MNSLIIDALLAWAHHLCAFFLLAVLFSEWLLLSNALSRQGLRLLGRLDLCYGALAALMLMAGGARVMWGLKGVTFYLNNPLFWAKLLCFALVGLLSLKPTLHILRWKRAGEALPVQVLQPVRRWVSAQLMLFPALLLLAPMMARGLGSS